jgi:hypothetical protein
VKTPFFLLALAACGSETVPDTTTPDPGASCGASTCEACLGIAGCNWTGDACAPECLQDVACFGPGNPAASSCPAASREGFGSTEGLVGSWHEDQSRASGDVHVFVPTDRDLGPSRFRQRYSFAIGGGFEGNALSPDDAHATVTGTWSRTPEGIIEVRYRDARSNAEITRRFEVVHIEIGAELQLREL